LLFGACVSLGWNDGAAIVKRCLLLVACAIGAAPLSSAFAQEQFVGRWALTPELCSAHGGETAETSALVATDTSLWWFDGYCRIGKMYKTKAVYVQAHCSGKGDVPVTLDAQGNRMRVTWGHARPEELKRCN
jgi:hypothetical protein